MTTLGPAPAPPLQPLRPEDQDSRRRDRQRAMDQAVQHSSRERDSESGAAEDFPRDEERHQLDERA